MKTDVTILTEAQYVNPEKVDWYVQQILSEDRILQTALEERGMQVRRKAWDDKNMDWTQTKCAIFRATWDYFHRFEEFSKWLETASQETMLINPPSTIQWNIDKHYLLDLEEKGIPIVPSEICKQGDSRSLQEWCDSLGGEKWVLKPTISGAARHTYLIDRDNVKQHEKIFSDLIEKEDMMLQPFMEHILTEGEVSLMVMNGKYTHAIKKIAKEGDFRVQDDFGGSVHKYSPSKEEVLFAERAIAACDPMPLYGRVDMLRDNTGQWVLGELELIEPELWFREHPAAADPLANGIHRILSEG